MSELFSFIRCPNCGSRPFLGRFRIYRCPVCFKFCCDGCIDRHVFSSACPHCHARSAVDQVGYTG